MVVITHPRFTSEDYINSINKKYISLKNVVFNDFDDATCTLIMGRSMITLPFIDRKSYTQDQLMILHLLLKDKVISVYSENHKIRYYQALKYFKPQEVVDLCDHDVYSKGIGKHFEKKIYFDIHKPVIEDYQFEYLFIGTNRDYYNSAKNLVNKYKSHGIIIYDVYEYDSNLNNIVSPVENLLGIFKKYVYTKNTVDPAPRLIQECKYHNKEIIYEASNTGAEVYKNRNIKKPDVECIINEL
tara:strand:+ start:832 stop:1557 length:726 start_codon:yes stop_codon:yes gene_type:complete